MCVVASPMGKSCVLCRDLRLTLLHRGSLSREPAANGKTEVPEKASVPRQRPGRKLARSSTDLLGLTAGRTKSPPPSPRRVRGLFGVELGAINRTPIVPTHLDPRPRRPTLNSVCPVRWRRLRLDRRTAPGATPAWHSHGS